MKNPIYKMVLLALFLMLAELAAAQNQPDFSTAIFKLKFNDSDNTIRLDPSNKDENPLKIDSSWISSITIYKDPANLGDYAKDGFKEIVVIEVKRNVEGLFSEAIRRKFTTLDSEIGKTP